ncbi:MAG: sensor histidine kinase [Cyanobacteria bacterium SZAS TMP-1]|nr:sensor histidine kinase [Cyanobacteria bacterium SZAS TMP-1]
MNDFLKQFFRTPGGGGDREAQPNREDEFIKEQFTTHQRLTGNIAMAEVLRTQAEELATALNLHAVQYVKELMANNPQLHLSVSEPARIQEPVNWLSSQHERRSADAPTYFYRWKVTGNTHLFSVRASRGLIEFFMVPDKEVPHITMSEFGSRFKGSFKLSATDKGLVWTRGKQRLSADQALTFIEQFLDQLSQEKTRPAEGHLPNPALMPTVEQKLELEKNNLLFKLLNQQEEMKNQLARDLHDSVIADLMMLKRYLAGDKKLSTEETIEIIDEVVVQVRDIVNDYSPRQLQEWGLKVGIEDLLDRMSRRTGIECNFNFEGELPRYPDLVSLHIFRLVQESLNNCEKHSGASAVTVTIKATPGGTSTFTISDNGTGFEPDAVQEEADSSHSFGLEGMRERTELIRCFYPCKLDILSSKEIGTTVTLVLSVFE